MGHRRAILLSLMLVLQFVVHCQSNSDLDCSAKSTGWQVSTTSQNNQNGNWVTKVNLERDGVRGLTGPVQNGLWTFDVNSKASFCEGVRSSLATTFTVTAPLPQVRGDYELFAGVGFYKFHVDVTTWSLARQICADEDAHLIIINSEKEAEFVKTLFARHPTIPGASHNNFAWIGVERKDDKYWTIFGESLSSTGFMRWASGQPNKGKEDCLLVERSTGDLYDILCDWKVAYICEHEL